MRLFTALRSQPLMPSVHSRGHDLAVQVYTTTLVDGAESRKQALLTFADQWALEWDRANGPQTFAWPSETSKVPGEGEHMQQGDIDSDFEDDLHSAWEGRRLRISMAEVDAYFPIASSVDEP